MSEEPSKADDWGLAVVDGRVVIQINEGTTSRFYDLGRFEEAGTKMADFLAQQDFEEAPVPEGFIRPPVLESE